MSEQTKHGIQMSLMELEAHYKNHYLEMAAQLCEGLRDKYPELTAAAVRFSDAIRQYIDQATNEKLLEALADAGRMDWLHQNSCDLRCVSVATGGDDYDINWIVIEHYMAKPHEREIGRGYGDDWRRAVDQARFIKGEEKELLEGSGTLKPKGLMSQS